MSYAFIPREAVLEVVQLAKERKIPVPPFVDVYTKVDAPEAISKVALVKRDAAIRKLLKAQRPLFKSDTPTDHHLRLAMFGYSPQPHRLYDYLDGEFA